MSPWNTLRILALLFILAACSSVEQPIEATCTVEQYVQHRVEHFCALNITLYDTDYWECIDEYGEGGDWAREARNFLWDCDESVFDCEFARECCDVEYYLAELCGGWSSDCWEVEPEYEFYTECRLYRMETSCLLELG